MQFQNILQICKKKILQDCYLLSHLNQSYIFTIPSSFNDHIWHFLIIGPPDSKIANNVYIGKIHHDNYYPFKPSKIEFTTPISSFCNGQLYNLFDHEWSYSHNISTILNAILMAVLSANVDIKQSKNPLQSHQYNITKLRTIYNQFIAEFPTIFNHVKSHFDSNFKLPINRNSSSQNLQSYISDDENNSESSCNPKIDEDNCDLESIDPTDEQIINSDFGNIDHCRSQNIEIVENIESTDDIKNIENTKSIENTNSKTTSVKNNENNLENDNCTITSEIHVQNTLNNMCCDTTCFVVNENDKSCFEQMSTIQNNIDDDHLIKLANNNCVLSNQILVLLSAMMQ
jgi:ubiquitin-protein ligase